MLVLHLNTSRNFHLPTFIMFMSTSYACLIFSLIKSVISLQCGASCMAVCFLISQLLKMQKLADHNLHCSQGRLKMGSGGMTKGSPIRMFRNQSQ